MEYFIIFIIIGLFIPPIRFAIIRTLAAMFQVAGRFIGVVIVLGLIVLLVNLFRGC